MNKAEDNTVDFDSRGRSLVDSITGVVKNSTITDPTEPSLINNDFADGIKSRNL